MERLERRLTTRREARSVAKSGETRSRPLGRRYATAGLEGKEGLGQARGANSISLRTQQNGSTTIDTVGVWVDEPGHRVWGG